MFIFRRFTPLLLLLGVLVVLGISFIYPQPVRGQSSADDDAAPDETVSVAIKGVDGERLDNIRALLGIYRLVGEVPPSETRLRFLHNRASEDIRTALEPFGFYNPDIQDSLEQTAEGWQASYQVDPGKPIPISAIDLQISGDGQDDTRFKEILNSPPFKVGDPLRHQQYDALKQSLQSLAAGRGYFDARFTQTQIRVDLVDYEAAVVLHMDTGQRYRFGPVEFGPNALAPSFLQRYLDLKLGQPYNAATLLKLQSDLMGSQYFDLVQVQASPDYALGNTLPVTIGLSMRDRTKYTFGIGYGTDTGIRGRVGVERRWVNRFGHRFNAEVLASQIKYGIGADYTIPGQDPRTDRWGAKFSFTQEESDTKEALNATLRGYYTYQVGNWTRTQFLEFLYEDFVVGGDEDQILLVMPGIDWQYVSVDDRLNVEDGYRLSFILRGAHEAVLSDVSFFQARVGAKLIESFTPRHRLLVRGELGTTLIDDDSFASFPSTLRFYTGGDNSVRGYNLDTISPLDEDGEVIGGKNMVVGSVEYEYRFLEKWAVAAFIDAGDAFNFDSPELRYGAGLGLRWMSPVGPVRVDLAHGFQEPGDPIRLHLSVGPDL